MSKLLFNPLLMLITSHCILCSARTGRALQRREPRKWALYACITFSECIVWTKCLISDSLYLDVFLPGKWHPTVTPLESWMNPTTHFHFAFFSAKYQLQPMHMLQCILGSVQAWGVILMRTPEVQPHCAQIGVHKQQRDQEQASTDANPQHSVTTPLVYMENGSRDT